MHSLGFDVLFYLQSNGKDQTI